MRAGLSRRENPPRLLKTVGGQEHATDDDHEREPSLIQRPPTPDDINADPIDSDDDGTAMPTLMVPQALKEEKPKPLPTYIPRQATWKQDVAVARPQAVFKVPPINGPKTHVGRKYRVVPLQGNIHAASKTERPVKKIKLEEDLSKGTRTPR